MQIVADEAPRTTVPSSEPVPHSQTPAELAQHSARRSASIKRREGKALYIPVAAKYSVALVFGWLWMGVSLWLAVPWADALAPHTGGALAWLIIFGIALTPGFMNAFMTMSLALDRRPARQRLEHYPELTVLVAAYNEEASIADTIKSLNAQHYKGVLQVIVINDGSKDRTADIVQEMMARLPWLQLLDLKVNRGKAHALNEGMVHAKHALVVTVDADSWLYKHALRNIVERFMQDPAHTCAVAGAVMVRNSRTNWVTRMQEWDYFQGIASVKRVQSLYHGTMVAQGAFSIFNRKVIDEVGGFPDCVGEDIVLTWSMLSKGYRIGHCEDALLFTNVPTTVGQFLRQRKRWARGLIEAFKRYPSLLLRPSLSTTFVLWNLMFPLLDLAFTLFFVPGLIACAFGYFWIVGPVTLALVPLALAVNYVTFSISRKLFAGVGLKIRFNPGGLALYSLFYSLLMQPVALWGYVSELLNLKKSWGTK